MKRRSFIRQMIWAGVAPSIIIPSSYAARSFNGTNQQFLATSCPITNVPATLATWVRASALAAAKVSLSVNDSAGESRLSVGISSTNTPLVVVRSSSGSTVSIIGSIGVPANTWVHVCGVYAATNSRQAYLNGVSDGNSTTDRTVTTFNYTSVGCSYSGVTPSTRWTGEIADAVIYNRALSDTEVAQLYIGGPRSLRNGLVFWTRMTEPGNLRDIVGGRTLTAYNSPTVSELHPRTR